MNPRISRVDLLKLAQVSEATFDQLANKRHLALAFGSKIPAGLGGYLALDAVSVRLLLEFAQLLGRADAAAIVREYWPKWLDAVGRAEHDTRYLYFSVAVKGIGPEREYLITSGVAGEINPDIAAFGEPASLKCMHVNVTRLLEEMRKVAAVECIAFPDPVFLSPRHPKYRSFLEAGERVRERAIERLTRERQGRTRFTTQAAVQ